MTKTIIAPSVLAADFKNLTAEFEKINKSHAEWIHFDVMDGLFVPNISFGFPVLEAVSDLTDKFIDVHLMIEHPSRYFETFKNLGADGLSIHFEKNNNLRNDLLQIKDLNLKCGLVINPDTPVHLVEPFIDCIDMILIMSVYPGFGGQKFIEDTYEKVLKAKKLVSSYSESIKIQVDGGVSILNSHKLIEAGADVLVCGSALFKANDFCSYVDDLMK